MNPKLQALQKFLSGKTASPVRQSSESMIYSDKAMSLFRKRKPWKAFIEHLDIYKVITFADKIHCPDMYSDFALVFYDTDCNICWATHSHQVLFGRRRAEDWATARDRFTYSTCDALGLKYQKTEPTEAELVALLKLQIGKMGS